MLVEPLGLASTIAGLNGGVFVRPDLSVIDSRPLDPETASQALKLILDQGLDAWVYTADAWLIRDVRAPHVSREAWTVKFDAQIVDTFTTALLDQAVKIVGVSDDADRIAACEKMLQDAIGTRASAALSQPYYLDVTNHDANKGAVVDKLSTLMAVAPEHIAAIGDMPNDILMFEKSGFSVAMGNASEMVKARASAVAESNNHDGFAKAIDRFILGHSQ
jgi:Cof subfamily protein (haloacid dehalogenase superfamily)